MRSMSSCFLPFVACCLASLYPSSSFSSGLEEAGMKPVGVLRIALIHMDSHPGEIAHNRRLIERAIDQAIAGQADWIVAPELAESGYDFARIIGTDWVEVFPDQWILRLAEKARKHQVALFVGIVEKEGQTGVLHNSVAVIDKQGTLLGTHRKFQVIDAPAERWATKGLGNTPFVVEGIKVGLLICADAYQPQLANRHKVLGAQILLSPANWPPVEGMGPDGHWEARSNETGLPLVVNNRTGTEPNLDFIRGESAVVQGGRRTYTRSFAESHLIFIDWDRHEGFNVVAERQLLP